MSVLKHLLSAILLHGLVASFQINLDLTDVKDDREMDSGLQHDCLHVAAPIGKTGDPRQIISYCMGEWPPSKWSEQTTTGGRAFTFAELYQQRITSEQLYLWSAPMDVVERYEFYWNQHPHNSETFTSAQLFYNCTPPNFGPVCQYSFDDYNPYETSLDDIVHDIYQAKYTPTTLTCYTHLQCNRGSSSACLDWTEICDGVVHCLDGGRDEEHCWQLEISECGDNEYECTNGQCIPYVFFRDHLQTTECLDGTDELHFPNSARDACATSEPTFRCEDVTCTNPYVASLNLLTSSCVKERNELLYVSMFTDKPPLVREECWLSIMCSVGIPRTTKNQSCTAFCLGGACKRMIEETCPDQLLVPSFPIFFGRMHFLLNKDDPLVIVRNRWRPQHVCFDDQLCGSFEFNASVQLSNNTACYLYKDLDSDNIVDSGKFYALVPIGALLASYQQCNDDRNLFLIGRNSWLQQFVKPLQDRLWHCASMVTNYSSMSDRVTTYQCVNSSKYISRRRLNDHVTDCFYNDDEESGAAHDACALARPGRYFNCTTANKCIPLRLFRDGRCQCSYHSDFSTDLCDDESSDKHYSKKVVSFPTLCDGFNELIPVFIDGKHETDETECEQWPCDNPYTRCDRLWNCPNGADEINCDSSPSLNCSLDEHICVSPITEQFMCLPIGKANDEKIDCLGATDEPHLCRRDPYDVNERNFHCSNSYMGDCVAFHLACGSSLGCHCDSNRSMCASLSEYLSLYNLCAEVPESLRSDVVNFFCRRRTDKDKKAIVHFSLAQPIESLTHAATSEKSITLPFPQKTRSSGEHQRRCHRGFYLRVGLDSNRNVTTTTCLCPPSFYGDMCQYQNQRVTLTLQWRTTSDAWRTPFAVVVSLIDDGDERILHSHHQFTYLPILECQMKFNLYLLYSTRPKNPARQHSVQVDIYEKVSLTYRGSWLTPITYPFLPVHRLVLRPIILRSSNLATCVDVRCVHGQCTKYMNDLNETQFCRCHPGWSGRYCTTPADSMCSHGSLHVGVSANNRSVCVCPLNRFGHRCLLQHKACTSEGNETCRNGGQCIATDEFIVSERRFTCLCPKGFSGDRCEKADTRISLSFHNHLAVPQVMFFHFIQSVHDAPLKRVTSFRTVHDNGKPIIVDWSEEFHLLFVELSERDYYLTVMQKTYQPSATFVKTLAPSDRCQHISELFNETILELHLLRRIKHYHVPCQRNTPAVPCFFDDEHLCFCQTHNGQRMSNCFPFNHQLEFNCFGQSGCENGAQCFQDSTTCAKTSICKCATCFYGARCQFPTREFSLSLDVILTYHILPHTSIVDQPRALQMSVALTTVMGLMGFIDGTLSLITFKEKKLREVGCGYYLLGSSITTLLTTAVFVLKFWILVATQITLDLNQTFLRCQCISIDFLLRIGLAMDQWLNACVAIERAMTTIQGAHFDKKKSIRVAKWATLALLLLTIGTSVHDPIHRRLIAEDDGDQRRIWCTTAYSAGFQTFNAFTQILYFSVPFLINIVSALVIIINTARHRSALRTNQCYKQHLREQFQQYNHLLIAPCVLVVLAVPRLIISFFSGCMKSSSDSWLFLAGYFISFIPSILTFVLFVLPSKVYKEQFWKSMKRYWLMLQTRLIL